MLILPIFGLTLTARGSTLVSVMSQLALSDSFEWVRYGSTAIINMFTPTARRSTSVVRI